MQPADRGVVIRSGRQDMALGLGELAAGGPSAVE
jgi:hypothetical protein